MRKSLEIRKIFCVLLTFDVIGTLIETLSKGHLVFQFNEFIRHAKMKSEDFSEQRSTLSTTNLFKTRFVRWHSSTNLPRRSKDLDLTIFSLVLWNNHWLSSNFQAHSRAIVDVVIQLNICHWFLSQIRCQSSLKSSLIVELYLSL